ncbi:MAG: tetratricopeptide repeat protein [Planctomycetota bacterium]
MSAEQGTPQPESASASDQGAAAAPWREIWQIPALGGAMVVLALGLSTMLLHRPTPNYDSLLDGVERRIDARRFVEALDVLNGRLAPMVGRDSFEPVHLQRFHTLRARALALGQAEFGGREEENDRNIVAQYRAAERNGGRLSPGDAFYLADAYLALDMIDLALARADAMPVDEKLRRHELYRRAVSRAGLRSEGGRERVLELIARFVSDPTLNVDDRAWAELQRVRLLAATGDHGGVVDRLLRTYPRWAAASPAKRAALSLQLGASHLELEDLDAARTALETADSLAAKQTPERARALVLLGRLDELDGRVDQARERYQAVLRDMAWASAAQGARLGLAEVRASEGEHDLALQLFERAIDELDRTDPEESGVSRAVLEDALLAQYRVQAQFDQPKTALRYVQLAERLRGDERSPELVRALADAHLAVADGEMGGGADAPSLRESASLDVPTRDTVRRHLRSAGGYYALHADLVTLDEQRFERSTWLSALCFDRAGDLDLAQRKLTTFVTAISESPLRAEARFRLGRIHQARRNYQKAGEVYRGLIDDSSNTATGKDVGPFAIRSYVPLAQCLLADAAQDNDDEAMRLLDRVLSGALVEPESLEYRTALLEMGRAHYRRGEQVAAIEKLSESLVRYGGERMEHRVRFLLADAYRREADRIRGTLTEAMPGSERRQLQQVRRDRLLTAMEHYTAARDGLETLRGPTAVEAEYLRNAYFYLGACPFDLGDYETAVRNYAAAHARYARDPSALVPLIQIVNARLAQGEYALAQAANERAQRLYASFPAEVWDDADLPMSRGDWQRWFEASERLASVGP